ncbi:GNAT family N-acetyltransferase [Alkalihalobacillus pseudalcaliphilus]|uniref:GNAT family N-acetyltransferase n=1 Tax=Alkalihalobacillus pseudalcaliphilus TaxID=79884 RepID=UPI00064E0DDA|nr:GNAT family protein [Alkalihalobacillus pseudalcaliphilus]KMK75782.1 acetyltransferase [Alkalihalobacillus pseudalcaliphilus]
MILKNGTITLRELVWQDWQGVHSYAQKEIVCRYQPWGPNSQNESQTFVQQALNDSNQRPQTRYVFAVMYEQEMIGAAEFNRRDLNNLTGEISYIIHPDYWERGIATTVAKLLIQYGFLHHHLHRIFATCDPRNIGSTRVLEKSGMLREGRIREHMKLHDGWRDSYLYSVLEQEWEG